MSRLQGLVLAAAGFLGFLGLWELVPRLGLAKPVLMPPPSLIPTAWIREVQTGIWRETVSSSFGHYLAGLSVGAVLGVALGVLSGMAPRFEAATAWVVRLLRPIPNLAWVPFAILWFGATVTATIFLIALGVFWIVFFAAHGAVRGVDRDLVEVAQAFGFRSGWARLTKVMLPAATPGILVGLRTALGQAWAAVVVAGFVGVPGIGGRMYQASSLLASDIVVVYMLTLAALYALVDSAFVALQGWLLRWRA